ncbi:MAG TPA: hypothetical protein DCY89_01250 [Gammaproteobacteria bacterium]|nr:hypothetical protein [Gammaproteobacteria bacterium]
MTANPDLLKWTDDFVSAQRGYWDLWSRLAQESLRADPSAAQIAMGGWADGFDRWWKGIQGGLPRGEVAPAMSAVADQMRWFMKMSEGCSRYLSAYAGMDQPTAQWQEQLERSFDQFRQFMAPGQLGDWADATRSVMGGGPEPIGSMMHSMAGLYAASADILSGLKGEIPSVMGALENETQRLLGIPAVGYSRETQEQMQRALQLHLAHQHAVNRFSMAMSQLTSESMDLLLKKLIETGEKGETISSLRGLYDLWVDSSEEVFARFALTDEYSRLYAEVVNTLMAFRVHAQAMVDDTLARMNLPTRRELNTQYERFHALRNQVVELGRRLSPEPSPAGDDEAARRIALLEEQVARLSAQLDSQAVSPAIPQPSAVTNATAVNQPSPQSGGSALGGAGPGGARKRGRG